MLSLLVAKPEQRAADANKLLGYMCINSMSGYVWVRHAPAQRARARHTVGAYCYSFSHSLTVRRAVQDELCRTRKNKPLPGLTIITEMIDSQGTQRALRAFRAFRALRRRIRFPELGDPFLPFLVSRHTLYVPPTQAYGGEQSEA